MPKINKKYKPAGASKGTRIGKDSIDVKRGQPREKRGPTRSSKPPCKGSGGVPVAKGKKRGGSGLAGQKVGKTL